jgi:hypothetical protein
MTMDAEPRRRRAAKLRDAPPEDGYSLAMRLPLTRLAAAPLALATLLAACTGGGSTGTVPSDSAAPGGSTGPSAAASAPASGSTGAGAPCQTAPSPNPANPPGWPIPGTSVKASVFPVIVSSEQICGQNRFLFSFLDTQNQPVAAPDRTASVAFYDLGRDPSKPVSTSTGTFLWAIEGSRGLYVTSVDFSEAGEWGAEFTTAVGSAPPETVRVRFEVKPTGSPIPIGDAAPSVKTPTATDVGGDLAKLSSDPSPDPTFFQVSVDQALADHKPFVLVFATPAFCTSGQCGPTLDIIKGVAKAEPGFTFINVEPYKLQYADGRLQPVLDANGQLQPVQATIDYGLLSEPWIFVVDKSGKVSASFEAIVTATELTAAIDAVR